MEAEHEHVPDVSSFQQVFGFLILAWALKPIPNPFRSIGEGRVMDTELQNPSPLQVVRSHHAHPPRVASATYVQASDVA